MFDERYAGGRTGLGGKGGDEVVVIFGAFFFVALFAVGVVL